MRIMTRALRFSNGKSRDDEQVLVRPTASRHAELVGRPTIGRPPGSVASLHEPPGSPGSGQASGVDAEIAVRAPLRNCWTRSCRRDSWPSARRPGNQADRAGRRLSQRPPGACQAIAVAADNQPGVRLAARCRRGSSRERRASARDSPLLDQARISSRATSLPADRTYVTASLDMREPPH